VKILLVTPAFPPVGGSHMHRVLNLANYLSDLGNEIHVLGYMPNDDYPNYDNNSKKNILPKIKVWYSPEGILHRKLRKKVSYDSSFDTRNSKIKSLLNKRLKSLKKSLLIPDAMIDWLPEAIKYEKTNKILETVNPDIIISSSMPNTSHIIGYILSKKYNIPLVMDYGDPWSFEISTKRNKFRQILEYRFEKKIVNHSKLIFVATEETRKLYIEKFGIDSAKIKTFMMGFNPINLPNEVQKNENLSMIYGGMLNPAHRNPLPFIQAFNSLKSNIDCKFYTDIPTLESLLRTENINNFKIELNDLIPSDDFMTKLQMSDVLILFGNSSPIQIAGKLFVYISTGKHILYIRNMDEDVTDPVIEILNEYGNITITNNTFDEIQSALMDLEYKKKAKQLSSINNKVINKYSWETQVISFYQDLRSIYSEDQ